MKKRVWLCGLGLALVGAGTAAQNAGDKAFPPEQVKAGAELYASNCATCHGNNMKNPPWAIDLATVPRERSRFIDSVTYGKNNMPPWGDVLKPADIDALWAYFSSGAP